MRHAWLILAAATSVAACQCGGEGPRSEGETIVLSPVKTRIQADVDFDATGQGTITVRAGERPVQVKLAAGPVDAVALPSTKDGDATIATAADLPPSGSALVVIERDESDGKQSVALFEWAWMAAQPGENEVHSADGKLVLIAQPGQLSASGRISIVTGVSGGRGGKARELAGPYRVVGPEGLTVRGVFQVEEPAGLPLEELGVYRLENDGKAIAVPHQVIADTGRVGFDAALPGTYVLAGKAAGVTP